MSWIAVLLILIVVLLLAVLLIARSRLVQIGLPLLRLVGFGTPRAVFGRGETAPAPCKGNYYHGSATLIAGQLEPRPHNVIGGERAVFATNNMSTALMFIGHWNDSEISYGTYGGIHHALELYPGAFEKLRAKGYIYCVDAALFHSDPRLGMQHKEFISSTPVPIMRTIEVPDALEMIKQRGEIELIPFDEVMSRIFPDTEHAAQGRRPDTEHTAREHGVQSARRPDTEHGVQSARRPRKRRAD